MLRGDETVSPVAQRRQKEQVSSVRFAEKTMSQAQDPFRFRTMSHGDQGVAVAKCTPRERLAERQRDSPPHGIAEKCGKCSEPRPNSWGNNFELFAGGGDWTFGVKCGCRCGSRYTIVVLLLGIPLLYPFVVGYPPIFCSCFSHARSCYLFLTVLHSVY